MKRMTVLTMLVVVLAAMLAAAGCNKAAAPEQASTKAPVAADAGAADAPAVMCAEHGVAEPCAQCGAESPAGEGEAQPAEQSSLTLSSGEQVPIITVAKLDADAKSCAGLVAIEGKVSSVSADRGAFVIVDCGKMAGCGDGCCPQAEVPVSLDMAKFEGSLPAPDDEVLVVGQLTVSDTGYSLAVREVRRGDEVLLKPAGTDQA